ncbi:MAG: hypothetical protein AAFO84_07105 [Cyanobacteria bacterium J06598_1]
MSFKSCLIRVFLVVVLLFPALFSAASPANAGPKPPKRPRPGSFVDSPPRGGDQQLIGSIPANGTPLIVDFQSVPPERFATEIPGGSADPEAIVDLVEKALLVWANAFDPDSMPSIQLYVGWADFGVKNKLSQVDNTLTFSTNRSDVDPCSTVCNSDRPNPIDQPGFSAVVAGDVIGLHICGEPTEVTSKENCDSKQLQSATILFNSEQLIAKDLNREVKLFLDSDPFNSKAFGPLHELGASRVENTFRVGGSAAFDEYPLAVDLFTVALHEVGHALGYSTLNPLISGTAHVSNGSMPDVMTTYIPFATRKCLSRTDINAVLSVGSYTPGAPTYKPTNPDPCGSVDEGMAGSIFDGERPGGSIFNQPELENPRQPIFRDPRTFFEDS